MIAHVIFHPIFALQGKPLLTSQVHRPRDPNTRGHVKYARIHGYRVTASEREDEKRRRGG